MCLGGLLEEVQRKVGPRCLLKQERPRAIPSSKAILGCGASTLVCRSCPHANPRSQLCQDCYISPQS
jgi:hypothetical protein